jgi:hypothetical protein
MSPVAMTLDIPVSSHTEIQPSEDIREAETREYVVVPVRDGGLINHGKREIRLIKEAPEYVRDRVADGNYPDQNGMIGSNRSGWKCVAYQRGGMLRLMLMAVAGNQAAVTDSWRAIDAAFHYQNPDGSFVIGPGMGRIEYIDRLNDVSFWLAKLCHALLIVQASDLGPAFEARIQALLPKIELSALYLADGVDELSHGDRDAANRLFFHAGAYGFSGALLGNQHLIELGRRLAAQGMAAQRGDGVFLEMGGYDSSYQGVSLLQFQQYTLHFPDPAADAALLLGAQWEVTRILPSGEINTSGNTRTGGWLNPVSYIEVLTGLLYCGAAQDYYPAVDAGMRVFSYFYNIPLSSPITGNTRTDAGGLQPAAFLHQNYPNPFGETTTIGYTLASGQNVQMVVYNMLGQRVRTLADRYSPEGYSQVTWDSRDDAGNRVSPGIYVIRLETEHATATRKVSLVE